MITVGKMASIHEQSSNRVDGYFACVNKMIKTEKKEITPTICRSYLMYKKFDMLKETVEAPLSIIFLKSGRCVGKTINSPLLMHKIARSLF